MDESEMTAIIAHSDAGGVVQKCRGAKGGIVGTTQPVRLSELFMCLDAGGRIWSYDPEHLIHYYEADEGGGVQQVFVASGVDYFDQMPTAFRAALPEDIAKVEKQ